MVFRGKHPKRQTTSTIAARTKGGKTASGSAARVSIRVAKKEKGRTLLSRHLVPLNIVPAWAARPLPLMAFAALSLLPALVLAFDGTRLWQLLVLSLSAWVWLVVPLRGARLRLLQAWLAGIVATVFLLDAAVRGFLLQTYRALPDSSMVITALANTSDIEAREFILAYWPGMLAWALLPLCSAAVLVPLLASWRRAAASAGNAGRTGSLRRHAPAAILLVMLLLLAIALSIKPWRKFHPFVFWPAWAQQLAGTRAQWQTAHLQRAGLVKRAAEQAPALSARSPDTLVLVISDSVNRQHLSLYGYPRPTTPKLEARSRQDSASFKVFRHAWSSDASTVASLNNLFHFGEPDSPSRQHLLALASAAGYQTWWISNHDDMAIDLQHAQIAHRRTMLNRVPGRSAASLDRTVLPALEAALQHGSPTSRKLIVVHLLGAHPHYRLRHPPGHAPFRNTRDEVVKQLQKNGRSLRTCELRNDYDSALHFHDHVVDQTLELTRRHGKNAGWIFLSDHGQEVGSVSDHAGHSASSADGYRIPLLVWGDGMRAVPDRLRHRPIRSDWLAHSVTRLLGMDWPGYRPERDFLAPDYRWQAPPHPVDIDYFS